MRNLALWLLCVVLFAGLAYPAGLTAASGIIADVNKTTPTIPMFCSILAAFLCGVLVMVFVFCASYNSTVSAFIWLVSLPCVAAAALFWTLQGVPAEWLPGEVLRLRQVTGNDQARVLLSAVGGLGFLLYLLAAALNHGSNTQEPKATVQPTTVAPA